MSRVIPIILDAGLDSQSDPEDVLATDVTNVELDKPGKIYKRKGRSISMYLNGTTVTDIIRWIPPKQSAVWVAYDSQRGRLIKFTEGV